MAFDISKAAYGKSSMSNLDKIKRIPLNSICTNTQNFYSIKGIDELADSIQMVGLLNPVTVVKDASGHYRLVSGHRRFEAYRKLREDAQFSGDDNSEWNTIPAIVLQDMDELSESLALVTANSTARELTYGEKLKQEQFLRQTLKAMKEAGREVPKNLGQYIADQIGVSRNEVSRMHSVNENLIPEAREKVAAGEMTAQQAYEMSRKPAEEQRQNYVESQIADYEKEARISRYLLKKYVEKFGNSLAYSATRMFDGNRFESISQLGKYERGSGGSYPGGISYTSSAKGVTIRHPSAGNQARSFSWTEVWDCVALHAMKLYGKEYGRNNDSWAFRAENVAASGWQNGKPTRKGSYVCAVKYNPNSDKLSRRVMWWHGAWCVNDNPSTKIDDEAGVAVLGWIALPEEAPE